MAQIHGSRRPRSPQSKDGSKTQRHSTTRSANKKNNETSLGGVLAAARRRGRIGTVLKNLGMGKGEPALHVRANASCAKVASLCKSFFACKNYFCFLVMPRSSSREAHRQKQTTQSP